MSVEHALQHPGSWAERVFLALDESPEHVELAGGSIVMSPMADSAHQSVVGGLYIAFHTSRPDPEWAIYPGLNVLVRPGTIRVPDIVIARRGERVVAKPASAVLLVAEITSAGNFRQDRIVKHTEYAEAGIRFYLRVDLHHGVENVAATVYELVDGRYVEMASTVDGVLRFDRPWPVEIDLRAAARG
ncbi:MAG: Uma2 family endonuclease [Pseudonocardia sp.]|nr:Uma2 family endonuclease [Pseudonocardia sp.]